MIPGNPRSGNAGAGRLAAIASRTVGRRVELAPHLDAWMRGARYGTVTRVTGAGLTVVTDRGPLTLRGLKSDDIGRWLD